MTAVVVSFNSGPDLATCLASLHAQELSDDMALRCLVVDNDSTDDSVAVAAAALGPEGVLKLRGNAGYAAALNAGAAEAFDADAILVLNADTELSPTAVRELAAVAASVGVGIAVPAMTGPEGSVEHTLRRSPTAWRAWIRALTGRSLCARWPWLDEALTSDTDYAAPTRAAWATGAAMYVIRACWDTVGGFDESWFLYSEETDFALRAASAGYALRLAPGAAVRHVGGPGRVEPDLWTLLVINRVIHHQRYAGPLAGTAMYGAMLANEILRSPFTPAHRRAALELIRGPRRRRQAVIDRLRARRPMDVAHV
ncbi:MAG: glycosyltransferase [Actinopolymorphaceae bacterium]